MARAVQSIATMGEHVDAFGMRAGAVALAARLAGPAYDRYFRVASHGAEHLPPDGPAILVANHAGLLPVDGVVLWLDVLRRTGRVLRLVADRFVPRLPFVGTIASRCGAVVGTRANVRHLLETGAVLGIFPEGVTGTGKPFRARYRLQAWRVGHAELAIRHRAPVIPVAIVGAEESWPIAARLPLHVFGAPYLPIPATPVPLPVRYHVRYGAPIALHAGHLPDDADDPPTVEAAAARTREALERLLAAALAERPGVFR